jgi:hypothetical protein
LVKLSFDGAFTKKQVLYAESVFEGLHCWMFFCFSITHLLIHPDARVEPLPHCRVAPDAKDVLQSKYCLCP